MKSKLEVKNGKLYLDRKEFHLLSGAVHYFRIHPSQWWERLIQLKNCGFNTVETYIAWNVQEPQQGVFESDGMADFEQFISIAEDLGLYVIVRPGPFICAEWEMGGLPSWLLNIEGIELRHYNEPYLKCVHRYFDNIMPKIVPHLSTNGGGVIAVQVENEYGGFGEPDTAYLKWLQNELIQQGIDVLMFTSDGTWNNCLEDGSLKDVLMTANFGSRTEEAFGKLEKLRPDEPNICMEFWNGWFDQWRTPHHTREPQTIIDELKSIIKADGHFNMYMFSGGTNFGFYNGSNCNPTFEPCITSYDYGAPVTECGDVTEQYYMLRKLLTGKTYKMPERIKRAYGKVTEFKGASLFDNLDIIGKTHISENAMTMEDLGQNFGYILYEMDIEGMSGDIDIGEPHDRAMFFDGNTLIGEYERGIDYKTVSVSGVNKLKILVENMGRVNYGKRIFDKKGLLQNVKIGGREVKNYRITTIPMEDLSGLSFCDKITSPVICKAEFSVDKAADTFLLPEGFTKGVAFVNGFNLGRYWSVGPQKTLYVPDALLKEGTNKLVIFDLYKPKSLSAEFIDRHILDEL